MTRSKGSKGMAGNGNGSVYYDLGLTGAGLEANPANTERAFQAGKSFARFSLKSNPANQLMIVDEGMGFPVTLSTALRTGAVYEGLDFTRPSSQRYIGGEFFREYVKLLIQPGLSLLNKRGIALNWAELGLVLKVNKGVPVALGFFPRSNAVTIDYSQPSLISPRSADCSGSEPDSPSFSSYQSYAQALLIYGLRPLVAQLAGFGVRSEVLWDIAVETLLEVTQTFENPFEAREALFIEELSVPNLSDPVALPAYKAGLAPQPSRVRKGFSFSQGQVIFLKQSCCEKYRKKTRCSNCPGNAKLPRQKLFLQTA
jgi:hypothetical protein